MGIRKQLNETGVSDDIECPHCGFESALHDYESRAEFTPKNFNHDGAYLYQKYCPLCGWSEYEDYQPTDEELDAADDDDDADWPDDPFVEAEPSNEQMRNSKDIQYLLSKAPDEADEFLSEYIWARHDPENDNIGSLMEGIFEFIFSQRG